MEVRNPELPPQPPGAVNALLNGFNVVANNIAVILFPIALDTLLWLGPRFRLNLTAVLDPLLQALGPLQTPSDPLPSMFQSLTDLSKQFNLLAGLRTYPLGIFSLMVSNLSAKSPLGVRFDEDLSNIFVIVGFQVLIVFVGCLIGCLYFYSVARVALKSEKAPSLAYALFHSFILALAWQFIFVGVLPLLGLLALLPDTMFGVLIFVLIAWPVTWLVLLIFFSAHGIFVYSNNFITSIGRDFRMLRYGMPPMGWFALMAIVISQGMDVVWRIPSAESWLALAGIFGHAFVSTGLLAASFIFYRDMNSWVDDALEWIKTHQITSARA